MQEVQFEEHNHEFLALSEIKSLTVYNMKQDFTGP